MAEVLSQNGFSELKEPENWDTPPGKYFVTRNDSSIVAFIKGTDPLEETGIRMVGAHTDSPCLKVKPRPILLLLEVLISPKMLIPVIYSMDYSSQNEKHV